MEVAYSCVQAHHSSDFPLTSVSQAEHVKLPSLHQKTSQHTATFKVGKGHFDVALEQHVLLGMCVHERRESVSPKLESSAIVYHQTESEAEGSSSENTHEATAGDLFNKCEIELRSVRDPHPREHVLNVFAMIDVDADQLISPEEIKHYFETNYKHSPPKYYFKHEDLDGDGYISWQEFSGPKGQINDAEFKSSPIDSVEENTVDVNIHTFSHANRRDPSKRKLKGWAKNVKENFYARKHHEGVYEQHEQVTATEL